MQTQNSFCTNGLIVWFKVWTNSELSIFPDVAVVWTNSELSIFPDVAVAGRRDALRLR
jgi:hypothetical protein